MHYVEPKLVANFEFATWTKSGRIRKPATFLGFRDDKNPLDVVREMPVAIEKIEQVIENQQNQDEQTIESNNPALVKYNDKRQFDQTPEPTGGKAGTAQLIFVVQKHNASHLHYDFRLEIRGVLKSWAVPKGPSMNPADHRLAMAVEDHPYDYKDFEGIIPEGQYGGGTVLVWDCGTYEPEEKIETKTEQEHWLLANYYKNKLNIILHGKKLKGKFNLVRTYGRAENAWLLTKVKDGYELEEDITQKDQSVLSGLTLLEVAMNNHSKLWQSNREPLFDHSDETTTSVPLTNRDVNDRGSFITFKKQLFTDEKAGLNNTINDLQLDAKELNDQEEKMPAESQIKHKIVGELFQRNKRSSRFRLSPESNWNRVFEEKIVSEGTIEIEGKKLLLTNIEKNLWKGTNKAQLITYYNSVAEFILPHLKGRPLSLHIKNLNAQAPGLYIKDMEGFQPDFLDIYPTRRKHIVKGKADIIDYAVCNNLPSLLWLINLGCIDINPWNSTTINPGEPDFIAINFEPSDDDFRKAVQAALYAKEYFDEWKLTTFIKTSGTAGIHVFIPCSGINYPQSKIIAEHICTEIYRKAPQLTTMEIVIEKRADKLFIDYYRNDQADTLASAYSVRAGKMPTVSTPISWDELSLKLKPTDFTIENIQSRLLEKGDLWKQLNDPNIKTKNSRILKQAKGFIMQTVTGNKVIRNSK